MTSGRAAARDPSPLVRLTMEIDMQMILFRRKTVADPWAQAPSECLNVQEVGYEYRYFLI